MSHANRFDASRLMSHLVAGVDRFNEEVRGVVPPRTPRTLDARRLRSSLQAMQEEIDEFEEATREGDVVAAADGLVDLVYFALGRLHEMGVPARAVFDEVQRANMEKVPGTLAKRQGWQGRDAVKPDGWVGPDHSWLLDFSLDAAEDAQRRAGLWDSVSPVFKRAHELRLTKGADYNNVPGGRDAHFPFGHASHVHGLNTKVLRLQSLVRHAADGRGARHESVLDSVVDLVNYGSYYGEALIDGTLADSALSPPASLPAIGGDA